MNIYLIILLIVAVIGYVFRTMQNNSRKKIRAARGIINQILSDRWMREIDVFNAFHHRGLPLSWKEFRIVMSSDIQPRTIEMKFQTAHGTSTEPKVTWYRFTPDAETMLVARECDAASQPPV